MVLHTAIFYSEEYLLEYLNGETKSMVEELSATQEQGTAFVIRRHNETSDDTETLYRNMHPSLNFKFMAIIASFTKTSYFKLRKDAYRTRTKLCLRSSAPYPDYQRKASNGAGLMIFSCRLPGKIPGTTWVEDSGISLMLYQESQVQSGYSTQGYNGLRNSRNLVPPTT